MGKVNILYTSTKQHILPCLLDINMAECVEIELLNSTTKMNAIHANLYIHYISFYTAAA